MLSRLGSARFESSMPLGQTQADSRRTSTRVAMLAAANSGSWRQHTAALLMIGSGRGKAKELLWLWHWQGRQPVLLKWKKPGWHSSHFGPYTPVLHTHVPELEEAEQNRKHESEDQARDEESTSGCPEGVRETASFHKER
ncbi:hypothetical protein EYF80_033356 [Liparis tanakae]|uniref:Uncharacterized protein n=1 Tax=Liparis tanakae TaxID=230148 RepID=A0A4Z2GSC6_9TELE|nr:hypothetical protein EYF80_033356 [Liparis tanakae]